VKFEENSNRLNIGKITLDVTKRLTMKS